jgi:hypothetical protein
MKKETTDDIRDLAIRIVDELVERKLIKNCLDTDDTTEFEVQDIIFDKLNETNLNLEL